MKQQFNEDRVELEAHFADRVRAYVELGETPEQAAISATEKFGETETVVRTLRRQKLFRPSLLSHLAFATGYVLLTAICKAAHVPHLGWGLPIYTFIYALLIARTRRSRMCRRKA